MHEQMYAQQYAREISDLLVRMPRPLLLLLKTNDCLRSVSTALGDPVNTYAITARFCARALAEDPAKALRHGWRARWALWSEQARMEMSIYAMRVMGGLARMRGKATDDD